MQGAAQYGFHRTFQLLGHMDQRRDDAAHAFVSTRMQKHLLDCLLIAGVIALHLPQNAQTACRRLLLSVGIAQSLRQRGDAACGFLRFRFDLLFRFALLRFRFLRLRQLVIRLRQLLIHALSGLLQFIVLRLRLFAAALKLFAHGR